MDDRRDRAVPDPAPRYVDLLVEDVGVVHASGRRGRKLVFIADFHLAAPTRSSRWTLQPIG